MPSVTIGSGQERIEKLIPHLKAAQKFVQETWPVRSNYASQIGHPCERNLYYRRHDWDKAATRDWGGVGVRGNIIADWWKMYMQKKGFKVIQDQLPLSDEISKKYEIGGRIDGRIGWGDIKPMVYEFKTLNEYAYRDINEYWDFPKSKYEYIRGYPAQIQLYLLSLNEEAGLFILCNPINLEWKIIPVYLDLGYCEWLLQRADRVNKANKTDTPPERIAYGRTCEKCDFAHICLPDQITENPLALIDDTELEAIVKEREGLKESVERFKELDEEAKLMAKKVGKDFILGTDWNVKLKKVEMTRVDPALIPPAEKPKYEVKTEYVKIDFVNLNKKPV